MNSQTPHAMRQNATMADTLRAMRALARRGSEDLEIRGLVERLTSGIASGDYSSEVLAIYYWVTQNIRYLRDPSGVELVKTPRQVLRSRAGDCDDMAVLLAAMLLAAGNSVSFAVASFRPGPLPLFSHVYAEVDTPHGKIALDPVANRVTAQMLGRIRHKASIPVGVGDPGAGVGAAPHVGPDGGNVYSVFDYDRGRYDYFAAPSRPIPPTGRFRRPSTVAGVLGTHPEAVAARLPAGARKTGSGDEPRGVIAVRRGPLRIRPTWLWAAAGFVVGALYMHRRMG